MKLDQYQKLDHAEQKLYCLVANVVKDPEEVKYNIRKWEEEGAGYMYEFLDLTYTVDQRRHRIRNEFHALLDEVLGSQLPSNFIDIDSYPRSGDGRYIVRVQGFAPYTEELFGPESEWEARLLEAGAQFTLCVTGIRIASYILEITEAEYRSLMKVKGATDLPF